MTTMSRVLGIGYATLLTPCLRRPLNPVIPSLARSFARRTILRSRGTCCLLGAETPSVFSANRPGLSHGPTPIWAPAQSRACPELAEGFLDSAAAPAKRPHP